MVTAAVPDEQLRDIFRSDEFTAVVTDSGLGGLSVAADLAELLRICRCFRRARIVFFNCMPSVEVGFDAMQTDERRYRVFSKALDCMVECFNPDAIFLACNTISCIYDKTDFAHRAPVPVLDIVGLGTGLLTEHLRRHPDCHAVLFCSKTTAHTAVHKKRLMAQGFPPERLSYQVCSGLFSAIENDAASAATEAIVWDYVDQALANIAGDPVPVVASLNCTHFGFVIDRFRSAFERYPGRLAELIDPTELMAPQFLAGAPAGRFEQTEVCAEVVTQTPHGPAKKASLGALLASRSAAFVQAVQDDNYIPNMYDIE